MNNTYYLMRHGHSNANQLGIITCRPDDCIFNFGLTEKGKKQAIATAEGLARLIKNPVVVLSSDFLRARETAEIVASKLSATVILDTRLRERDFKQLHGSRDTNYKKIWAVTDSSPEAHPKGVESDEEVRSRVDSLIDELESNTANHDIILVSHGDPLNIINAYYVYGDTTKQSHDFANAQVRLLSSLTPSVTIDT